MKCNWINTKKKWKINSRMPCKGHSNSLVEFLTVFRGGSRTAPTSKMERLSAVNYYLKALHLGCCSSPRSASGVLRWQIFWGSTKICHDDLTVCRFILYVNCITMWLFYRRKKATSQVLTTGEVQQLFSPGNDSLRFRVITLMWVWVL